MAQSRRSKVGIRESRAHRDAEGRVDACTRLLPTTGPYLLCDVFANLIDGEPPRDAPIWESTRRAGWDSCRMGGTVETGTDTAAAEWLTVSQEYLARVRKRAGASGPVIGNLHEIKSDHAVA